MFHNIGICVVGVCAVDGFTMTISNHRIMARELDLSPLEAEIILQALEPVATAYSDAAE
jgi:hypothetical protein